MNFPSVKFTTIIYELKNFIIVLRRKTYDKLLEWKKRDHKPLLIKGQRQVGKTFIIREFAKNYSNYVEIDFRSDIYAREAFSGNLDADSIIHALELLHPEFNFEPHSTLILFDEVQDCPRAYSSLKYFAQDRRYDIIASGSLLGVTLHNGNGKEKQESSIPVGYVEHLTMYSLDFEEFLWAKGIKQEYIDELKRCIREKKTVPEIMNSVMSFHFRDYMVVGGMPEAVSKYIDTKMLNDAISVQNNILEDVLADINKYNTASDANKTTECFKSIPSQLAKSNKKFMYSAVDGGGSRNSAQKYSDNLLWIKNAGYGNFCYKVLSVESPLSAREDRSNFKIYFSDTGLLMNMYGPTVRRNLAIEGEGCNMGAIAENVIAECIMKCGMVPRYYSKNQNENRMELDFVMELGTELTVIEVKSGKNRESPSLSRVSSVFKIDRKVMFENTNIRVSEDGVEHYPIYAAAFMDAMILPE